MKRVRGVDGLAQICQRSAALATLAEARGNVAPTRLQLHHVMRLGLFI